MASYSRELTIAIIGGVATSAITGIWGVLGGRWHLVVERCHGSTFDAVALVALGALLTGAGVAGILAAGFFVFDAFDFTDYAWALFFLLSAAVFLWWGGSNLLVDFTDPTGTPSIVRFTDYLFLD